jgi:hypothetical protein
MKIDTKDVEQLESLRQSVIKNHSITATTDQRTTVRITIAKDASNDEIDSWITADEVFDVKGSGGQSMMSEFDFLHVNVR